jgi:hypothetical protein
LTRPGRSPTNTGRARVGTPDTDQRVAPLPAGVLMLIWDRRLLGRGRVPRLVWGG